MSWLTRWLNSRAVRRYERIHDRELLAGRLWRAGRFAEFAAEMAELAEAYGRQTRLRDAPFAVLQVRARRCEALIRAGQPALAEAEAAQLNAALAEVEGPGGARQREFRRRLDAAYRGEELPYE